MYLLCWYFLKSLWLSQICVIHFARYPRRCEYNYSKFGSALILHTIFELYHAKTIYMIGWMSNQVEKFVVLSGTGTILPWFLSIKLFTLSVHHCTLNTSAIESFWLHEDQALLFFFFLFSFKDFLNQLDCFLFVRPLIDTVCNIELLWKFEFRMTVVSVILIDYLHR